MTTQHRVYTQPTRPLFIKLCHTTTRFRRLCYLAAQYDISIQELVYEILDEKIAEIETDFKAKGLDVTSK